MTPLWPDLTCRATEPEAMDLPECDLGLLKRTVEQYERINRVFTANRRLIRKHLFPAIRREPGREHTWLDLGAGGCDIPRWIVRTARRNGWRIRVTAVDRDARIAAWARAACSGYPEITVVEGDAVEARGAGAYDFVTANHLLHHLGDADAARLVRGVDQQARLGLLINDLRRSRAAYLGYFVISGLTLRSSLAFADGLLSIRRGFAGPELQAWLAGARPGTRVFRAWPARIGILRPA